MHVAFPSNHNFFLESKGLGSKCLIFPESYFDEAEATLREIIGIIYSGLYGNNTCDNLYRNFARLLRNFYLTTGNNRLAKVSPRSGSFS